MENLWATKILNFYRAKNPSTVENLWVTSDAVLVFYVIGYPYVIKVWVYYLGTATSGCAEIINCKPVRM